MPDLTQLNEGLITIQSNVYLIEINKTISYMPLDKYIQEASKGPNNRFYIHRGAAGGISISEKNITILACGVLFLPK